MKPIFVLGVGAQKAGTTWLHRQLNKQNYANFGFIKEYHIWDAIHSPLRIAYRANIQKNETAENALIRLMQTQDGVYENYFRKLMSKDVFVTGDITPSYSLLDSAVFSKIRSKLETVGFDVKVVFLMRDPTERIWSSLKMIQRNQKANGAIISDDDLLVNFEQNYKSTGQEALTRYDKTVMALRNAFDESNLHFEFYERLFNNDSIERLSHFLDINLNEVNLAEKINSSKSLDLPNEVASKCREHFSDVYDFCNKEFPETKLLWVRN